MVLGFNTKVQRCVLQKDSLCLSNRSGKTRDILSKQHNPARREVAHKDDNKDIQMPLRKKDQ